MKTVKRLALVTLVILTQACNGVFDDPQSAPELTIAEPCVEYLQNGVGVTRSAICEYTHADYDVFDDSTVSTQFRDIFRFAASVWCKATDGRACARLSSDEPESTPGSTVSYVSGFRAGTTAYCQIPDIKNFDSIVVSSTLTGDSLAETIVHELGHHFGCEDEYTDTTSAVFYLKGELRFPNESDIECASARVNLNLH